MKNIINPTEEEKMDIRYSQMYYDDHYEYRHVIVPTRWGKCLSQVGLLKEKELREIGVIQSRGWEHCATHPPEPHIMMFRRPSQNKNIMPMQHEGELGQGQAQAPQKSST